MAHDNSPGSVSSTLTFPHSHLDPASVSSTPATRRIGFNPTATMHSFDPSEPPHIDLAHRLSHSQNIIFPAITAKSQAAAANRAKKFNASHRLVDFKPLSHVMIGEIRDHALAAPFTGPYIVIRKTKGGSYELADSKNNILPRKYAPSQLKLISEPVQTRQVGILNHRDTPTREYLVRWSDYPASPDTWLLASYCDLDLVHAYIQQRISIPSLPLPGGDVVLPSS